MRGLFYNTAEILLSAPVQFWWWESQRARSLFEYKQYCENVSKKHVFLAKNLSFRLVPLNQCPYTQFLMVRNPKSCQFIKKSRE